MCTTVLMETVAHYMKQNSDVYVCLVDASKAFDKVKYDKLYHLLMQRNIPSTHVRFLLDGYLRQQVRAPWDNEYSAVFTAENGVRQGGVISPILFTIYFDELLIN